MGSENDEARGQHTVMATYRLRPDAEAAFRDALARHWPTLRRLELVEPDPALIFRREDETGRVTLIEIFTWKPGAVGRAHQHPEVAMTWENMGEHLMPHGELPPMAFPHFSRLDSLAP